VGYRWTTKQRAFCEYYLANGFNGTQAARDARYAGNDVTLASVAYENLRKPHIAFLISERMRAMAMSADEAMARLSDMARGNMAAYIDAERSTIDLAAADRAGKLHLIKKFTHHMSEKSETITVELYDAQAALNTILKEQHLRAGEVTDRFGLPDDVLDILKQSGRDVHEVLAKFADLIREEHAKAESA
jgi:phage terminase small subunit